METNLNKIINKAHENAVKRNEYDCEFCNGEGYIQFSVDPDDGAFCEYCNGTGKTPQKNIIAKLLEEVVELEKALAENRESSKVYLEYHVEHNDIKFIPEFEKYIKNTIGDELADIAIEVFAAAEELEIDIISHIIAKNKYNEVTNE